MNQHISKDLLKQLTRPPVSEFFSGHWYGRGAHSDSGGKLLLYVTGSILPIMYFLRRGALNYAQDGASSISAPFPGATMTSSNSLNDNLAGKLKQPMDPDQKAEMKKQKKTDFWNNLADNDEMFVFATNF